MQASTKTGIAIILGIGTGIILGPNSTIFSWIGTAFLRGLNMLIIPLIFSSMVSGIAKIPNRQNIGYISAMALALYTISTAFAIALGFFFGFSFPIGKSLSNMVPNIAITATPAIHSFQSSWSDILISIIPNNPIQSFADQNILQIIVFALFFGIALHQTGTQGAPIQNLIDAFSSVMQSMTNIVMKFSPFGVFSLMATAVGNLGIHLFVPILLFLLLYYLACALLASLVALGFLKGISHLRLKPFFYGIKEAILTSISTCSSSATLPIAMKCATDNLGVEKRLSDFTLPLGCSLNMNGSALFQTMATLFIANVYGITITQESCIALALTVLFSTIGTASVPGAGFMMLSIVFSSAGVPLEGLTLLAGIDRLRDMATTSVNIFGDIVCTVVLAQQTGNLDTSLYESQALAHEKICIDKNRDT